MVNCVGIVQRPPDEKMVEWKDDVISAFGRSKSFWAFCRGGGSHHYGREGGPHPSGGAAPSASTSSLRMPTPGPLLLSHPDLVPKDATVSLSGPYGAQPDDSMLASPSSPETPRLLSPTSSREVVHASRTQTMDVDGPHASADAPSSVRQSIVSVESTVARQPSIAPRSPSDLNASFDTPPTTISDVGSPAALQN